MILDNIELIKKLLKFDKNVYYFLQVIQRRRENPTLDKSEIQRGYWYITSIKDLDIHTPKIICLCHTYNARAYISLVPRSLEKFAKKCIIEFGNRVFNNSYTNIFSVPQSVALSDDTRISSIFPKPYWIIDIDSVGEIDSIEEILREKTTIKIVEKIPTVRGIHLIVECFNPTKELSCGDFINQGNGNYSLSSGESFSLLQKCNTVMYAAASKP